MHVVASSFDEGSVCRTDSMKSRVTLDDHANFEDGQ
jgi:hypothetical protein